MPAGIWKAYVSRGLSAWGDRMWNFAVGLFMAELSPGSLQLPAIYGLTIYLCVIFLGGPIGRWVDKTARLKAAQSSLTLQNGCVILCASCVCLTLHFKAWLDTIWGGWGLPLACTVIIILAGFATLASLASSLCLNKDWIVVLASGDQSYLAKLNSHFRSIDLTTYILAPILVGQIITWTSIVIAAIVIAAWNLASVFIEYYLLLRIYRQFPALAVKKNVSNQRKSGDESVETDLLSNERQNTDSEIQDIPFCSKAQKAWDQAVDSWKIYWSQSVRNAGLALASLYMTVLAFDTITTGYAYSQNVSEWILGVLTACGALVGLLGSVSFPYFVKCMGLERTGLYGFSAELMCLTACVLSIFLPGSPFHLYNEEIISDSVSDFAANVYQRNVTYNETGPVDMNSEVSWYCQYISIAVMLAGIVSARFGLWLADLSVTQIMQENVPEDQRGAVGGIQDALQASMNTLKFALVAALPRPDMFGYLVMASYLFIFLGWVLFATYSRSVRGHLLPFHKIINATHNKDQHYVEREGELSKAHELKNLEDGAT